MPFFVKRNHQSVKGQILKAWGVSAYEESNISPLAQIWLR